MSNQDNNTSVSRRKKKKRPGQNSRQRVHWVDALQAYKREQEIEKPAIWAEMRNAATTAQEELADPDSTLTYLDEHTREVLYGPAAEQQNAIADNDPADDKKGGLTLIVPPLLLALASAAYSYHRAYQKVARVL